MKRIVDAHIHYLHRKDEEKNLLRNMDAAGVDKSLVLALPGLGFLNACLAGNEEILALCERHPDRLAFGAHVDPREKGAVRELKRLARRGARAIKLFPPLGFYPDDDACLPIYEIAAEFKLPVLSHTGATNCDYWPPRKRQSTASHFADPIRFDGLARRFPEVKFMLAHMGFPWALHAWYAAAGNGNVYLDISGGWFWLSSLPAMYEACGRQVPIDWANKVMWGSDNCHPPAEHIRLSKKLLRAMGCPAKCFPAIFGETAAKVFGI